MKKNCERCKAEFEPKHPSRKYCSHTCKQYAYFERNGMNFGQVKDQPVIPVQEQVEQSEPVEDDTTVVSVNEVPVITQEVKLETVLPVAENKNNLPTEKAVVVNNVIDVSKLSLEQFSVLLKSLNPQKEKEDEREPVRIRQPHTMPLPEIIPEEKEQIRKTFSQKLSERALEGFGGGQFIKDNYPNWSYSDWNNIKWVNERLKSHFRKLMHYSKKWIYVKDVKLLFVNLKEMMGSFYFRYLPKDYPFTNFVTDVSGKLQRALAELEKNRTEKTRLKMAEGDYIELKSIVFEIGSTVPDVDHNKVEEKKPMNRYLRRQRMRELGMTPGNHD